MLKGLLYTILGIEPAKGTEKPTAKDNLFMFWVCLIAFSLSLIFGLWFIAILMFVGTIYAVFQVVCDFIKSV